MSAQFRSGAPASNTLLRQGTATIALGQIRTAQIADTAITASSVILCWGIGAGEVAGGATVFSADVLAPGAGFTVGTDAIAIAAKDVGWAILKY